MYNEKLHDAVEKLESESATEAEKEKATEIVGQETDKLEDEKDLQELTTERLDKVFVKGEKLDTQAEPDDDSKTSTPKDKEKTAEDEENKDDPTPEEAKKEAELETEKEKSDEDALKETDAKVKVDKEKEPQLSEAYYRAVIHEGWKPEEIKEFYEANPKLATTTFGKIYEAVNRASRDFAAIGRARKEQTLKPKQQPKKEQQEDKKVEFKGVDIKKLRKQYPDDPVVELVESMQNQNKTLFEKMQDLEDTRSASISSQPSSIDNSAAINREAAVVEQQIETFFANDDLKGYREFYGILPKNSTNWDSLTPGQKMNRWAVIEMMDQIKTGAVVTGVEMSIDNALRRAHLSITEPVREQVIRDDIKTKVTKRSKSLTLEPSSAAKSDNVKSQTKEDLETLTTERLNKVFG